MPIARPTLGSPADSSCSDFDPMDRYVSVVETPTPVRKQSMDRTTSEGRIDLIGRGLHMPTQVLGQVESPRTDALQLNELATAHKTINADINARARRRSQAAVQATLSQAASAAAAAHSAIEVGGEGSSPSLMTLLTFGGVEVVFSTTTTSLVGVCSRTHFIFQKLHLVSDAPVTSLTSNSTSGMLVVAHQDGMIQTYNPERTDPNKISFGKYIWVDGLTIDASKVFYQSDEIPQFFDRRQAKPGQLVDISSSADHKLLVAQKTQLAVFEVIARRDPNSPRSTGGRLLWTTMLPTNIVTAKISGDGQAIVVVLEDDHDDEGSFGARTFIHDLEDGSLAQPMLERSTSVGMVFKPGPFLKHGTPVTRLSFRGLGRVTSSTKMDGRGNDLLLTYCKSDSAVRIFNQNSWKQLMLWAAPPNSRADWIRGTAAFSLGDLESTKKNKGSRAPSRRPSGESLVAGGINASVRNTAGNPTTAAGAWIAEITFRGAFPALRLSRLSYMKRGKDDSQPAHFESVAAILPAGSLVAESILNSDDMGLAIQGVWPAWNPWLSEPTGNPLDQSSTGSAMDFLGLSSIPPPHSQYFGESYLGGTHSPPTELRIAATHPVTGNVVVMEFPLWGDDDFGAMELGSPLRSVLSLSNALPDVPHSKGVDDHELPCASINYDSSRLCAHIDPGQRSISLLWRKQGSQSLYSPHFLENDSISVVFKSTLENTKPQTPQWMEDRSLLAAPLALPKLRLPNGTSSVNKETIVCIKWWPDDSFDGPPLLLALTRTATLLVFEIPPPRSAREPAMPNFDPFNTSSHGSVDDLDDSGSEAGDFVRSEYDVGVTPHPDFGLGLRLESPMDGLRAIAGSFKKHPLNGGMLPAEKTGMIVLGDEVLSVNGVSLENMTFDDIIATVRHVGAEAGPGKPLMLRFRPVGPDRATRNSAILQESFKPVDSILSTDMNASFRRKAMLGVSPKSRKSTNDRKHSDAGSLASMLVGSCAEPQQEFGRVIAVMRKAIPAMGEEHFFDKRFVVTPWGKGVGAPSPYTMRGAVLILVAIGNKILVKRMALPVQVDPNQAEFVELGSFDLEAGRQIRSLYPVDLPGDDRCYAATFETGEVILLFLELKEIKSSTSDSPTLSVSLRQHKIFCLEKDSRHFEILAPSINLFATYEKERQSGSPRQTIKVFTSRSDPMCRRPKSQSAIQDEYFGRDYVEEEIEIDSTDSETAELCDVKFLDSGHLDSFPTMVVFFTSELLVYQRHATKSNWAPIARVSYSTIPSSFSLDDECLVTTKNPCDSFPHLLPMIHSVIPSYDEGSYLLSDWHPESLLAYLCTDDRGAKIAMKEHVQKIVELLAELVDSSSSNQNILSGQSRLLVAPFESVGGPSLLKPSVRSEPDTGISSGNASLLFSSNRLPKDAHGNHVNNKLEKLLTMLGNPRRCEKNEALAGKSREFKLAMSLQSRQSNDESNEVLPPLLEAFPETELRVLWAITYLVKNQPTYDKIDAEGQFSLAIFALHKSLKKSPLESKANVVPSSPYSKSNVPSFYQRNKSSNSLQEKSRFAPQCASAAAVSAMLSQYQGYIVENIREPGLKLDWETVRESRAAFWVRSDEKLRQIAEQVGQSMYRETRDILKAAIFFLAAGKLRTLRNLAAADCTESGKKFSKFLTGFDFSSDRGRSAAEKNAYSLLRKNKYECAAAFFLLAEPPMLQSAVETIASKLEDLDLAFMVSRLISSAQARNDVSEVGLREAGMGFGGILGGGGGYAGMRSFTTSELEKDKESFAEWNPKLPRDTVALLESRMLPNVLEDSPFCALLLLWLGRRDEAWHWLSGFVRRKHGLFAEFVREGGLFRLHETTSVAKKSQDPTIEMTNAFINFVSGPLLLKQMNAASRTRIAASLMVASSLCKIGIELPAMRALSQADDGGEEGDVERPPKTGSIKSASPPHAKPTPSIFDSFDPVPQAKAPAVSSIFDDYDCKPQQFVPRSLGEVQSSVFDSFDVPSAPPKKTPVVNTSGGMESSIFDSFDAQPRRAAKPSSGQGAMESSIFDSFDAPPPPKPLAQLPQADMTSSIFDSFDVPRPHKTEIASSMTRLMGVSANGKSTRLDPIPTVASADAEVGEPPEPFRGLPPVWKEWRQQLLINCAARRVVRELATLGSRFHIDEFHPTISPSGKWSNPIIPTYAAQLLQLHANGDEIIGEIQTCLNMMSATFGIKTKVIVQEALRILEAPYQYHRVCFAVLLHLAEDQLDDAEDIVRNTAHALIEKCTSFSFSNDHIPLSRQTISHLGGLSHRQTAAHLSWQLEICLWLHRGGAFPMSGLALNESICAVRIGMLIASWNRDFEVQSTMIRQPPDCLVDTLAGRQLCTSLKMISNLVAMEKKASIVGSGGWEFLVDCKRAEATELLRAHPTGCFIIRPHSEDHGVFTLSFKTNLKPNVDAEDVGVPNGKNEKEKGDGDQPKTPSKSIRRDDVVQHAIIRLSDSGFRCGSFGPFATLMKLLEAVSGSLPFKLRFDLPPTQGVIKDQGSKPSPNCAFFRKLGLSEGKRLSPDAAAQGRSGSSNFDQMRIVQSDQVESNSMLYGERYNTNMRRWQFGLFLELIVLSAIRKQLSGIAAARYETSGWSEENDADSVGSTTDGPEEIGPEQEYAFASRLLRPLLTWCRMVEISIVEELAPPLEEVELVTNDPSVGPTDMSMEITDEATTLPSEGIEDGDGVIRKMIKPGSGVEFRTLRLGEGGETAMVVLFSKKEAVAWFIKNNLEEREEDAMKRLDAMETNRVIESIDYKLLLPKLNKKKHEAKNDDEERGAPDISVNGIRYRLVDPWEVEPLESREAETRGAVLGRHLFHPFGLGRVGASYEFVFRSLGGPHLLELWAAAGGGVALTKSIATVHSPWERGAGGDLHLKNGVAAEPDPFDNSVRQHLYRNALFRRLGLPPRFMALIQVELLDLKNLTSPGGSLSLTAYSLLRLKRPNSKAPLTMKARTLDSAATQPTKLGKVTGPNAPASWGSLVRFRFPLPEDTASDGRSNDSHRESLFKGAPCVLQVSVYEKKFMSDTLLGGADVKLNGLSSGGQLEEWVPLRTEAQGINWFARIRLTLRFELMCLSQPAGTEGADEMLPSVGLRRIQQLSSIGGLQEEVRRSTSTPDLLSYFESMVS